MTLSQEFTEAQIRLLENGDIDVGFINTPIDVEDIETIPVQEDRFVAVLYASHPLVQKSRITLRDLADEHFVLGTSSNWRIYHDQLFRVCQAAGFEPNVVQQAPESQGIIGLVACGMGVSIQTENLKSLGGERVVFRRIDDCDEKVVTSAAWNIRFPNPTSQRFMRYVKERFQLN